MVLDSEEKSIQLKVSELPPVIESLSMPSRVVRGRGFTLSGDGHDPMEHDDLLDWTIYLLLQSLVENETLKTKRHLVFLWEQRLLIKQGPIRVILTNDVGLTDEKTFRINVRPDCF